MSDIPPRKQPDTESYSDAKAKPLHPAQALGLHLKAKEVTGAELSPSERTALEFVDDISLHFDEPPEPEIYQDGEEDEEESVLDDDGSGWAVESGVLPFEEEDSAPDDQEQSKADEETTWEELHRTFCSRLREYIVNIKEEALKNTFAPVNNDYLNGSSVDEIYVEVLQYFTDAGIRILGDNPDNWSAAFLAQYASDPSTLQADERDGCYLLLCITTMHQLLYGGCSTELTRRFVTHVLLCMGLLDQKPLHFNKRCSDVGARPFFVHIAKTADARECVREVIESFKIATMGLFQRTASKTTRHQIEITRKCAPTGCGRHSKNTEGWNRSNPLYYAVHKAAPAAPEAATATTHQLPCRHEGCSRRFSDRHAYRAHLVQKHDDHHDVYKCHQCDQSFRTASELAKHCLTHGDVGLLSCHVCPKTFKSPPALANHLFMEKHGAMDDPELCRLNPALLNHELYHCKFCEYAGTRVSARDAHQGAHKWCPFCEETELDYFVKHETWKRHVTECANQHNRQATNEDFTLHEDSVECGLPGCKRKVRSRFLAQHQAMHIQCPCKDIYLPLYNDERFDEASREHAEICSLWREQSQDIISKQQVECSIPGCNAKGAIGSIRKHRNTHLKCNCDYALPMLPGSSEAGRNALVAAKVAHEIDCQAGWAASNNLCDQDGCSFYFPGRPGRAEKHRKKHDKCACGRVFPVPAGPHQTSREIHIAKNQHRLVCPLMHGSAATSSLLTLRPFERASAVVETIITKSCARQRSGAIRPLGFEQIATHIFSLRTWTETQATDFLNEQKQPEKASDSVPGLFVKVIPGSALQSSEAPALKAQILREDAQLAVQHPVILVFFISGKSPRHFLTIPSELLRKEIIDQTPEDEAACDLQTLIGDSVSIEDFVCLEHQLWARLNSILESALEHGSYKISEHEYNAVPVGVLEAQPAAAMRIDSGPVKEDVPWRPYPTKPSLDDFEALPTQDWDLIGLAVWYTNGELTAHFDISPFVVPYRLKEARNRLFGDNHARLMALFLKSRERNTGQYQHSSWE